MRNALSLSPLVLCALLCGCSEPDPLSALQSPDTVTLISVDCRWVSLLEEGETRDHLEPLYPGNPHPQDQYRILGQLEISDESTRQQILEAVNADLQIDSRGAMCFDPRHLLRVTKRGDTFNFLICYSCHWYEIYRNGQRIQELTYIGDSSRDLLNRLLTDAGIEILPE